MFPPWRMSGVFITQESHIFSRERHQISFVDINNDSWNGLCFIRLCCVVEQSPSSKWVSRRRSLYGRATVSQKSDSTDLELIMISKPIAFLLACSPTSPRLSLFWKLTCCMKGKSACPCSDTLSKHVCSRWDWLVFVFGEDWGDFGQAGSRLAGGVVSLWHKQKLRALFFGTQGGCVPLGEQLI